jgi:hypothetical protein
MNLTGKAMLAGRPVIDFLGLQMRDPVTCIVASFPLVVFCYRGHPPILLHISCSDLVPFPVFPMIKIAVAQNGFYEFRRGCFIV